MLPFDRFEGADAVLGPEMRSTGEVMGIARDFPTAFAKAQAAAGAALPQSGTVVHHRHRLATSRRAAAIAAAAARPRLPRSSPRAAPPRRSARMGIPVEALNKIGEGSPHVVDWIERGDVDLVVNTPTGSGARTDGWEIRRAAVAARDPVPDDARRAASPPRARSPRARQGEAGGPLAAGAPSRAPRRRAA